MELPVGVGALAIFLTFYLRISINPLLPLSLLLLGCAHSMRLAYLCRNTFLEKVHNSSTAIFVSMCAVILITLSFPTIGDGFLLFPNDFDSNLIHVAGPRIIVDRGYFFNPDWLRGLWLPQLTMTLYTFVLTFSNQLFLKTLNVVCFLQIALLFASTASTVAGRYVALFFFTLLTTLPEFRQYIVQTNLDTIFAFFTVSAFFLLLKYLKDPTSNPLILLAFICGLSAGQKHFGLMYSAPVMAIASLVYTWHGRDLHSAIRRTSMVGVAAVTFLATFTCFYFHNILSGNALLFPFIGSKTNTYGWSEIDLTKMLESTIPNWGHSKTVAGYFLLPFHLIQYPGKYQFQTFGMWPDLGMSVTIAVAYILTTTSLLVRSIRRMEIVLPCLVLCADILLWYRGSQVIRYLFPVLISLILMTAWLLQPCIERVCRTALLQRSAIGLGLAGAILLLGLWLLPPQTPLAQNEEEMRNWFSTYRGSKIEAFKWLAQNAPYGEGILNIAGQSELAQFPRLTLCGDFFGRCRYQKFIADFTADYIQFYPWPKLKEPIRANKLSYIVVNWDLFKPWSRLPANAAEWAAAIPESTRNCLEHLYNDGGSTDVYKVKEACLL